MRKSYKKRKSIKRLGPKAAAYAVALCLAASSAPMTVLGGESASQTEAPGVVEHVIRKTLAEVQAELTQPRFLRCNQSFIVNMDYVTCADRDFTMDNGDRIPIKVRERRQIRERYLAYILDRGWENPDMGALPAKIGNL